MKTHELETIAQALVPAGKGILAADEGDATIKRRFDSINVECTEANRRAYREMLFTTPGTEEFISGVILFEETLRQTTQGGTPFPNCLRTKASYPVSRLTRDPKISLASPAKQ